MSATLIPFPESRIFRHPDLIEAVEKLALADVMVAAGDPIKAIVAAAFREFWEQRLASLGGVPVFDLKRDGLDL